jgi:Domain of unknown function (DUF4157)
VSRARAVAAPPALLRCLERVLDAPLAGVRVIEHSRYARLHLRAVATTRPERIYLRDGAAEFFANPWLMLHEYCHVVRQWRSGRLTVRRYLAECLRRGYWNNRFEVEARAFADLNVARLHALLALESAVRPAAQPSSASRR